MPDFSRLAPVHSIPAADTPSQSGAMITTSALTAIQPDPATAAALDELGYVLLPGRLTSNQLATLRQRYDDLMASEGDRAGTEVHQENGTRRLAHLVDKGTCFDPVWSDPLVLGCVAHVLRRPFRLSSLNGREPLPGAGHQALHADWGARVPGQPFHVANSLWLLDDLTADNGATRVVPGTHLLPGAPADHGVPPGASHSVEQRVIAPAGSVVVINAHCWHGGSANVSGARRRILHAYYVGQGHKQQYDLPGLLSSPTRARLSDDQRRLLGCDDDWWSPPLP